MDNPKYSDDEIDLREYIEVMLKRKKTILTIFLMCVIITTVISFLTPRVYETSAIIKIGNTGFIIGRDNQIVPVYQISKEEAILKLQAKKTLNLVIQKLNLNIDEPVLTKTMKIEDINNTNLLKIRVQNSNPQLAVRICNAIADSFIQQNKEIYEKRLFLIKEEIDRLGKRNEILEKAIEKINQALSSQPTNQDFLLMQNTLSNYEDIHAKTNQQIYSLRKELMNSQQFEVFEPATTAQKIKPNKKLNIAVSVILGLFAGIFVAFFQEYWEKGK